MEEDKRYKRTITTPSPHEKAMDMVICSVSKSRGELHQKTPKERKKEAKEGQVEKRGP